jgi:hypothetical protein
MQVQEIRGVEARGEGRGGEGSVRHPRCIRRLVAHADLATKIQRCLRRWALSDSCLTVKVGQSSRHSI